MNSSPQAPHRSPCSTNVKPSISDVISSAGTSLRFPQVGHRVARLSLGSRDDEDFIVLGVVSDHPLLVSFLLNEDLPLSLSDAHDPEGVTQRFPQVGLIPVPFSHPGVPEVFADVNVDPVEVEREQDRSLSYVMNFIYIKIRIRLENPRTWRSDGPLLSSHRFLYQGGPPAERHAKHRRLPRHLRVQLAGPSRLRRGPREAPGGRTPKEPGGDARVAEEHLPPHPLRARRVAERDRAGRLRGPRHAREGLRRSPIHGAPSRIPGENHCKGKTVPRQAHRQGSRPRRAAGMEDPPSSAARCVDAGDPRAGPPHGRTDRPPLADRCRTTRNDVDRRALGDERRPRPFVVAEVTRRGPQVGTPRDSRPTWFPTARRPCVSPIPSTGS